VVSATTGECFVPGKFLKQIHIIRRLRIRKFPANAMTEPIFIGNECATDFHLTVITHRAHETKCLQEANSECKLMRVMAIIRTELSSFSAR